MLLVTAQQMKQMDQRTIEEFGLPGMILMENAARAAVQVVLDQYPRARSIALFCGKGNNGGDGLAMARYFHNQGFQINVFLTGAAGSLKGDAAVQLRLTKQFKVPVRELEGEIDLAAIRHEISHYDLLIDALLGTGLEKEVRGIFRDLILLMNDLPLPKIAVDIPSGLSSDNGQPLGICTRADLTVTFGLPKIGQVLFPGSRFVGRLFVVDIGIPADLHPALVERVELLEAETQSPFLPQRDPEGNKGSYGHVLVLAGSKGKTGAASLTCLGALRAGAGLVTLGIPDSLNAIMEVKLTEAMTEPLAEEESGALGPAALSRIISLSKGKKAMAIGPGISTSPGTQTLVQVLVKQIKDIPFVIDADGLNALADAPAELKELAGRAIITPHPGEMSRLTGQSVKEIQADRIGSARSFSRKYGVILVLKGARTVIADPEGPLYLNPVAHSVLASGGTGDVLTGLILGFLAQGLSLINAACLGVFLHGQAGAWLAHERGGQGILASELADKIPSLISRKGTWQIHNRVSIPLIREMDF